MIAHQKPPTSRATITFRDKADGQVAIILDIYPKMKVVELIPTSHAFAMDVMRQLKEAATPPTVTAADKDQTVFGLVDGTVPVPPEKKEDAK